MAPITPFEKRPNGIQLNELQRRVIGDRLSVRALGERLACEVAEAKFPVVTLNDEIIEKINVNATKQDAVGVGHAAVQTPGIELQKPADSNTGTFEQAPRATVTELRPQTPPNTDPAYGTASDQEKMLLAAREKIDRLAA